MRADAILLSLVTAAVFPALPSHAGQADGQICVAPLPADASRQDHLMQGGKPQRREPHYEFSVQIDDREAVALPADGKPLLLPGLATAERHRVIIRDRKKRIESFWFTFESRGGERLCLSYGPWYQTWSLEPPRPGARRCACDWRAK